MSLISLDRSHPDFQKYLRSELPANLRALPEMTFNPHTERETITFRLIPFEQIQRPFWLKMWAEVLHLASLPRALVPAIWIFSQRRDLDPDVPWLVIVGLIFLHSALALRNEIHDHLSGTDRVNREGGSRALQKGWLVVGQMEFLSKVFLFLTVICVAPLVWLFPSILSVIFFTAVVGGFAFFRSQVSFKDIWGGEFSLFLLAGPLLMMGLVIATGGDLHEQEISWSILWGAWVITPVEFLYLEQLPENRRLQPRNLVTWGGFDLSRKAFMVWCLALLLAQGWWISEYDHDWILLVSFALVAVFGLVMLQALYRLQSPIGSGVRSLRWQAHRWFALNAMGWVLSAVVRSFCAS